jgi:hypothetical protein
MRKSLAFVFLFLALTAHAWGEDNYTGTYAIEGEFGPITVVLQQDAQGQVQGTMTGNDMELRVQGATETPGISGTVSGQGMQMGFVAQLQEDQLFFKLFEMDAYGKPHYETANTLIFQRQGTTASPPPSAAKAPAPPPDTPQVASGRKVVINGTPLSDQQIGSLEQLYNVKIQDGAYWYDKVCGAWGLQGGPTAGFILPNLALGGPLRADASNGNTGVFVNGRQLHVYDVLALQQLLGTVNLGRYWLDAQGNVGIEGGPFLLNLLQYANAARSRGQGSTTYRSNITGIGGGSSGGTSYVMGKNWSVMVGQ